MRAVRSAWHMGAELGALRPALWARPGGYSLSVQERPRHGATIPAAQALALWPQTQELAPQLCHGVPQQDPRQHPDWIRVRAVPGLGRSLQEGGRR